MQVGTGQRASNRSRTHGGRASAASTLVDDTKFTSMRGLARKLRMVTGERIAANAIAPEIRYDEGTLAPALGTCTTQRVSAFPLLACRGAHCRCLTVPVGEQRTLKQS